MRVTLIHNPTAGDDREPDAAKLTALLEAAGHVVRYQSCREAMWQAVLDEPADLVAVAGGDGTVGRIAKKLIGRDIPVAPLPVGTANNISKTLGLDAMPIEEIVAGWKSAHCAKFDAGVAKGPWGSRYFVEGAGTGLFARTLPEADRNPTLVSIKNAEEKLAYSIRMLRQRLENCPAHHLGLVLDGVCCAGEYVLFEAMNMEFIGPNLYLAPDVNPNDGRLDVVLVSNAQYHELRESLAQWQHGDLKQPQLTRRVASLIELDWDGSDVHIDDEAWPDDKDREERAHTHIELCVERGALQFLQPAR